ncbi:MAG: hypothetical protein QM601_14010 [Pseudoxanthomonas sp.]
MSKLFKGLGLLMDDNALHHKPLAEQAAHWSAKSDRAIEHEIHLLDIAKGQWLAGSVIAWLGVSLTALAIIADNLWEHSYNPSFAKIVLVLIIWVAMLFVLWLIANVFDQKAGFARWFSAFASRAPLTRDSDSLEEVAETIELAKRYPDVMAYKLGVSAKRPLRHEDLRIMREMGRQHRHAELARELEALGPADLGHA